LIKNQETSSFQKVPFFGSLPLIGTLFRHSAKKAIQSNLMVFITPHIVSSGESVDMNKMIEEYDVHDMGVIEKSVHNRMKRIHDKRHGSYEIGENGTQNSNDSLKTDAIINVKDSSEVNTDKIKVNENK
jgi:hypothetical protein